VVLRKAYGGAYIVMDSKGLGNDWCAAWATAEIAVMGARGGVQILHGRRLAALDADARARELVQLEDEYREQLENPYVAAERGFIDDVIAPVDTRRAVIQALDQLSTKREPPASRRHGNTPL
jgi:propionyl-CoA carboxylase beta chain